MAAELKLKAVFSVRLEGLEPSNLFVRSEALYPIELQALVQVKSTTKIENFNDFSYD